MASSSSQTSATRHGPATVENKINDAVYEFYKPATGFIDLDVVFFHGFQAQDSQNAYRRTWMLADETACWLNTWLPERFPQSRIMSVSYDSSTEVTDTRGRMDMYLVGENLARSIIELAEVGQTCPVILVGHCVGGLVLKEVCSRAEHIGCRLKAEGQGINPYETFLRKMEGAFFYSTAQIGSRLQVGSKPRSPLFKYYELLSSDSARLNSHFQELRKPYRYGWKTFGVSEASETENCKTVIPVRNAISRLLWWQPQSSLVVEEGSARYDMDEFCVLSGEDNPSICKPRDQSSSSFQLLVKFMQGIVEEEEWTKKQWRSTLRFPRVYMSMPHRVEEVIQRLRLDEAQPSRISLVGMGGVGKSTVAKAVLVEIRSQFDFICFVENVKDRLQQHNLHTLVASNLYSGSGSKVKSDGDAQSLWRLLKGKKVLLVLDDVDSEEHISTLLLSDWVGEGSRLMTTSRVVTHMMPSFVVHQVPFLSVAESLSLFLAHVDPDVVKEIPNDLINQVVAKCDGLPLTVEVIGSYLRLEKDASIWTGALARLGKAESLDGSADDRLWAKLRLSFDTLGSPERRMFLDLAGFDKCVSNGIQYDLSIWRSIWSSGMDGLSVNIGLKNLVDKSLIRITSTNQHGDSNRYFPPSAGMHDIFYIHEQLRDMGKSICRPSHGKVELCRGVWELDDVDHLLAQHKGDNAHTEALSLVLDKEVTASDSQKQYDWRSVGQLQELRLLRMSNVGLSGMSGSRFPSKLVFLHMINCFRGTAKKPFGFLESRCWPIREEDVEGLHSMTVLALVNCYSVRFPQNFHRLSNLRILTISGEQFRKLPKNFGLLPSLQVLVLERVGLSKFPASFQQLSSLQSLKVSGCSALKTLSDWSITKSAHLTYNVSCPLRTLERLTLENLPGLSKLPEALELLDSLQDLDIIRCSALSELPDSLGKCHQLRCLRIEECHGLQRLCESFGELTCLSSLWLRACPHLQCLPDSLGQLTALKELAILDLNIVSFPASIWNLKNLFGLRLQGLENLKVLPECLGQIRSLTIWGCKSLQRLPESLGNLEHIFIERCESLEILPTSIRGLNNLQYFSMTRCGNVRYLPEDIGQLETLTWLYIEGCESLETLPESVGRLKALEALRVWDCKNLKYLPASLELLKARKDFDWQVRNNGNE